ncbi:MAG TPA: nitroreductase [Holophagaceae bacterium]|nr:nitroreductase [Holophagaceae bacterium]
MNVLEAIRGRRSIRAYGPEPVDEGRVRELLDAAIHAPSAMNRQPWAFVVIQDPALLKSISDRAKAHALAHLDPRAPHGFRETLSSPDTNLFYDAGTLILICASAEGGFAPGDCCLAAQNLMLAAHALGLGTCPIGLALGWLGLPESKRELGIPAGYAPVLPLIVGHPREHPPLPQRHPPEVLRWIRREP